MEGGEKISLPATTPLWLLRRVSAMREKTVLFHMIQGSKHYITNSLTVAFQIGEMDPY